MKRAGSTHPKASGPIPKPYPQTRCPYKRLHLAIKFYYFAGAIAHNKTLSHPKASEPPYPISQDDPIPSQNLISQILNLCSPIACPQSHFPIDSLATIPEPIITRRQLFYRRFGTFRMSVAETQRFGQMDHRTHRIRVKPSYHLISARTNHYWA